MTNFRGSELLLRFKSCVTGERALKILISAFIVVLTVTSLAWLSPETEFRNLIVERSSTFWEFFGMRQRWELFAPEIRETNHHSAAFMMFEDGTTTIWDIPHNQYRDQFDKFAKDRYHKWSADVLPWSMYEAFWPDLARYAGRLHYDPQNSPKTFILMTFTGDIPKPKAGISRFNMPPHTSYRTVFTYRYHPEDFR
jgi:hypothetical protein